MPTKATMPRASRAICASERLGRLDEAGAEQEILRRIAGDRELGEEDDVCAGLLRLVEPREDPLTVPVEVADRRVDLSECESHRFSTMSLKHTLAVSAVGESRSGRSPRSRPRGRSDPRCRRAPRGCTGRRARPLGPRRARARAAAPAPAASTAGRRPKWPVIAVRTRPGLKKKTGIRPRSSFASVSP